MKATLTDATGTARIRSLRETPGAFYFLDYLGDPDCELIFSCPCGCGRVGKLDLKPHFNVRQASHRISDDHAAPTLDEEVVVRDAPDSETAHWRGRLVDGEWQGELV